MQTEAQIRDRIVELEKIEAEARRQYQRMWATATIGALRWVLGEE